MLSFHLLPEIMKHLSRILLFIVLLSDMAFAQTKPAGLAATLGLKWETLENYYQNHRRYMRSRNDKQLLGNLEVKKAFRL